MKLLALDTSTEACSVALAFDGSSIERFEINQKHGERLLVMVQELLAESQFSLTQLDAIAFGRGPGSFTSLRIGAGVVQGLAFGADLTVVPVSSLAALAQGIDAAKVLAAVDARMRQVYWGAYVRGGEGTVALVGSEIVAHPEQVPVPEGCDWAGAGSGWDQYADVLHPHLDAHLSAVHRACYPHAKYVAALAAVAFRRGEAVSPEQAVPVYIRDDVAAKPAGRR